MFCTPWKTLVSISEVLGEIPPLHNIAALFAYRLRYVCRFAIKVGSLDKVVPHSTWAALFVNQPGGIISENDTLLSSAVDFASLSLSIKAEAHTVSAGDPPQLTV